LEKEFAYKIIYQNEHTHRLNKHIFFKKIELETITSLSLWGTT